MPYTTGMGWTNWDPPQGGGSLAPLPVPPSSPKPPFGVNPPGYRLKQPKFLGAASRTVRKDKDGKVISSVTTPVTAPGGMWAAMTGQAAPDATTEPLPDIPDPLWSDDQYSQHLANAPAANNRGGDALWDFIEAGGHKVSWQDAMNDPSVKNIMRAREAEGARMGRQAANNLLSSTGAGGTGRAALLAMRGHSMGIQDANQLGLEQGRFLTGLAADNANRTMQGYQGVSNADNAYFDNQLDAWKAPLAFLDQSWDQKTAQFGMGMDRRRDERADLDFNQDYNQDSIRFGWEGEDREGDKAWEEETRGWEREDRDELRDSRSQADRDRSKAMSLIEQLQALEATPAKVRGGSGLADVARRRAAIMSIVNQLKMLGITFPSGGGARIIYPPERD